jgi:hypothetical protein
MRRACDDPFDRTEALLAKIIACRAEAKALQHEIVRVFLDMACAELACVHDRPQPAGPFICPARDQGELGSPTG